MAAGRAQTRYTLSEHAVVPVAVPRGTGGCAVYAAVFLSSARAEGEALGPAWSALEMRGWW